MVAFTRTRLLSTTSSTPCTVLSSGLKTTLISSPGRICLGFKKGRTRSSIAWADGGFTPKRASTVASVSPRRNLTPIRGGSSAATGGEGLSSCSFCGGLTNGALKIRTTVATARPVRRTAEAHRRCARKESRNFRCFITMNEGFDPCTVISTRGQRKNDEISAKRTILDLTICSVKKNILTSLCKIARFKQTIDIAGLRQYLRCMRSNRSAGQTVSFISVLFIFVATSTKILAAQSNWKEE